MGPLDPRVELTFRTAVERRVGYRRPPVARVLGVRLDEAEEGFHIEPIERMCRLHHRRGTLDGEVDNPLGRVRCERRQLTPSRRVGRHGSGGTAATADAATADAATADAATIADAAGLLEYAQLLTHSRHLSSAPVE